MQENYNLFDWFKNMNLTPKQNARYINLFREEHEEGKRPNAMSEHEMLMRIYVVVHYVKMFRK